jgi:hypothetical protein
MTESALVRAILLRFGSHPQLRLWRSQPLVARTRDGRVVRALPVGFPDISGVTATGRMIAIEVKTTKGSVTARQIAFLDMLRKFGALVILARSVEDVERGLGLGVPVVDTDPHWRVP